MSSATSIDPSTEPDKLRAGPSGRQRDLGARAAGRPGRTPRAGAVAPPDDPGLRPWQFFVLAGMLAATAAVIVATGQSPASIIILSLTVVATSLVALGAYRSLSPLVLPGAAEMPAMVGGRTRAALEREKTLVLRTIKELEFDHAMGKIAQADFDEMSGRLRARAIGLMRQLDAGGYVGAIEQELNTRLLGKTGHAASPDVSAASSPAIAAAASAREILDDVTDDDDQDADALPSAVSCVCGVVNDADARFCKNCGTKLVSPGR
jgi:hypothetical protein